MNKLIFLMLVASVCCVPSRCAPTHDELDEINDDPSQLALFENDDGETSGLKGDKKIFSDYCLSSRDEVKVFLKSSLNDAAAKVFNVMFNTIGEVTDDLAKVQEKAVQEGVELIKKSGIEQHTDDGTPRTKSEVEAEIKENVKRIQRPGLLGAISEAVRTVINAVIQTISSETAKRLALLKEQFNGENAREQIENACGAISIQLKYDLGKSLQRTRKELLATTDFSEAESLKSVIENAKVEDVGCTTTGRITMVSRFCDILLTVGPVFYPLVGL